MTSTASNGTPATASGRFLIGGDMPVTRLGFGAMRITGTGIWGDPEETGKPFAADLVQRKLSIPIIHALADRNVGPELSLLCQGELEEGSLKRMLKLLDQAGARCYTEQLAARYHQQTLAALDEAQAVDHAPIDTMREITHMLIGRKS